MIVKLNIHIRHVVCSKAKFTQGKNGHQQYRVAHNKRHLWIAVKAEHYLCKKKLSLYNIKNIKAYPKSSSIDLKKNL